MDKYSFFDENRSVTRVGRWIVSRQNRFLIERIERHHSADILASILEVGPGHGAFARACREHGLNYQAIEANESIAQRLRNDGFVVTTAAVPPLPAGSKPTVIVFQHVLEHMRSPDEALALLTQCAERMVPGGLLFVCSPDITVMGVDFFDCDYTHAYPTSIRRLIQIFSDAGFAVVETGLQNAIGTNRFVLRAIGACARLAYALGLFSLMFGGKAYIAKTSLYGSCYAVGRLLQKEAFAARG